MSIVRACIRVAAVAALRDRGWADVKVFDSDNRPFEAGIKEEPAPYVVVFTDDDNQNEVEGRDVAGSARSLSLVVEFGIAAPLPALATDEDPPNTIRVAVPPTDAAYELTLDAIDTAVVNALILDPRSAWGEIIRDLAPRIMSVTGRRGGAADKGVRWAARQRIFEIEPIIDPAPGVVLGENHPISKFLAAVAAAPEALDVAGAGTFIEKMLSTSQDWTWRVAQASLGLTVEEVRGIGVAPAVITDDTEAPALADDINLPQVPTIEAAGGS